MNWMNRALWEKTSRWCTDRWKGLASGILILALAIVVVYSGRAMTWEMFLDFVKVLFDLIKGIAWPLGILTAALIFKADVKQLLPRIRKLGTGGVELDRLEQQQLPAPVPSSPSAILADASPAIKEIEDRINADLSAIIPDQKQARLVRQLAGAQASAFFENTYGLIFGTQIRALEKLREVKNTSTVEARDYFYSVLKPIMPEASQHITFEDWISFLVARRLITMDHTNITITEMGIEFLNYLRIQNRPFNRPL